MEKLSLWLLCFLLSISLFHRGFSSLIYAVTENEKTLAMIKPDGVFGRHIEKIKMVILESGFTILKQVMWKFDEETAKLFYAEHSGRDFFPSLIKFMTSGPVVVMVLEKENAVADWRALIGPTDARKAKVSHPHSIRAMCGSDSEKNCVHGSDSRASAAREIPIFFPEVSPGQDIPLHDEL